MNIEVIIQDLRLSNNLPTYATTGSAGIDLMACTVNSQPLVIQPNQTVLINTGLRVHIKDAGIAGMILPRSGLGNKGLVLGNLVGLIDSDYQGELKVSAWNRSDKAIEITPMMKIAQMIFVRIATPTFTVVEDFESDTVRGSGGFGSTGN